MVVGLASIFVFSIVLLIYLHVVHQRRLHEDSEINILEISKPDVLTEVCDLRVPFVFSRDITRLRECGLTRKDILNVQHSNNVRVIDLSGDMVTSSSKTWSSFCDSLNNKDQKMLCEGVEWPLKLGSIQPIVERYEDFWKPYMNVLSEKSISIGAQETRTQFRQSTHGRQFITCLDGSIHVSLSVPTPFFTDKTSDNSDYVLNNRSNSKCDTLLSVKLSEGQVLCVPPYWWYSIMFGEQSLVLVSKYRSFANFIANIDTIGISLLRHLNTHKRINGPSALDKQEVSKDISTESILSSVEEVE